MEWVVGIQVNADARIFYVHMDDLKRCATPDPEPSWPDTARGTSIVVSTRAPSTLAHTDIARSQHPLSSAHQQPPSSAHHTESVSTMDTDVRASNTDDQSDEILVKIDTVPDTQVKIDTVPDTLVRIDTVPNIIVKTDTVPVSTWDLQDAKESLVRHLLTRQHARGMEVNLGRKVAKQMANQNCFWPVNQTVADKLLRASKRIIRYVALYSMAGVAMESRLFRIHPSARDTPFIDACAAFLTPKMDLSQVMPSGCNLRRVAHPPANQLTLPDRPSASDYQEEEETINPADMHMAITAPVFQPYRGATGRAWMAQEYGLTVESFSLLSSGTERDDTDDETFSFDLGPEAFDPSGQIRLPSDEWLDDHQQGL